MKKFLYIVVALALFVSCEKSLEFRLEEKGGNLVMFAFLTPDSSFNVHLSKSVSHMSVDDFERIYDGNITVYRNGKIVDDFIFPFDKTWVCRDDVVISEGDTFRIEAYDSGGQNISAETLVPYAVPVSISDTATIEREQNGNGKTQMLQCKLKIPDRKGVSNYYQLLAFEEICVATTGDSVCQRTEIDYSKTDPVFYVRDQEGSLIGGLDFGGCFSDHLFDGENYELTVYLPVQYANAPQSSGIYRKILFLLLSHTREYYDYYRSRSVAEYGYELPLLDPIRIYNNVEGGLGVVSAYSISADSLVFNQVTLNPTLINKFYTNETSMVKIAIIDC